MSDFVDQKITELQARRDELAPAADEQQRLRRAIDALKGPGGDDASGFLQETLSGLQRRHDEQEAVLEEHARLEGAIRALQGLDAKPARSARSGGGTGSGKRGRPKGSGERSRQALELVRSEPGLGASEIARRIGVHANYAYRILPGLEEQGMIEKRDRAWYPTAAA